jgi:RNA polymerase sigma-70 factor, ECF subfamily
MTDSAEAIRRQPGPGAVLPWLCSVLTAAQSDAPGSNDPPADVRAWVDLQDVRAAENGDHDAFERIVRRYQQEIAHRLRRFSRDPVVIEELTQETFVQAFMSLSRYRGDAPLLHWLHRIAVRAGYRHWTQARKDPVHVSLDTDTMAASGPSCEDGRLAEVLEALSPRDRLVLTLLHLEGHSVAQTAALTGWSRTMVKVQAFRARARLRKLMRRFSAGEER